MKKIIQWLSGGVIKEVGDVIDKLTTTKEEKLLIKKQIQEIVCITGLRGAEIPRFMAATFMLAGALGHPAYALINAVIKGLFGYDSEEELTKWAINESAKGDLNGMVGQFITRGFPA